MCFFDLVLLEYHIAASSHLTKRRRKTSLEKNCMACDARANSAHGRETAPAPAPFKGYSPVLRLDAWGGRRSLTKMRWLITLKKMHWWLVVGCPSKRRNDPMHSCVYVRHIALGPNLRPDAQCIASLVEPYLWPDALRIALILCTLAHAKSINAQKRKHSVDKLCHSPVMNKVLHGNGSAVILELGKVKMWECNRLLKV